MVGERGRGDQDEPAHDVVVQVPRAFVVFPIRREAGAFFFLAHRADGVREPAATGVVDEQEDREHARPRSAIEAEEHLPDAIRACVLGERLFDLGEFA